MIAHLVDLRHGERLHAVIDDGVIRLVGENPQVMLLHDLRNRAHIRLAHHRTRRVAGGVDDNRLRLRRDALLDVGRRHVEAVLLVSRHRHGNRAHDLRLTIVVGKARIRDQNLIARIQQRQHAQRQTLQSAHGHDHVLRLVARPVALLISLGNRLAQHRQTGIRRIVRVILVERLLRRLLDVGRRLKVRLAQRQCDDIVIPRRQIEHLPDSRRRIRLRQIRQTQFHVFHLK